MEESQHQTPNSNPSYWTSIGVAGLLFGIISFVGQLTQGYMTINSASGSNWIGTFFCLVVAFAGMVAVWHYANQYDIAIALGKGALIGFLAALVAQFIGYGLMELWQLINPAYAESFKEAQIAVIEQNDQMPDQWKQQSIDYINDPGLMWTLLIYVGTSTVTGILGLLTGMIGAKIFGKKEEVF